MHPHSVSFLKRSNTLVVHISEQSVGWAYCLEPKIALLVLYRRNEKLPMFCICPVLVDAIEFDFFMCDTFSFFLRVDSIRFGAGANGVEVGLQVDGDSSTTLPQRHRVIFRAVRTAGMESPVGVLSTNYPVGYYYFTLRPSPSLCLLGCRAIRRLGGLARFVLCTHQTNATHPKQVNNTVVRWITRARYYKREVRPSMALRRLVHVAITVIGQHPPRS